MPFCNSLTSGARRIISLKLMVIFTMLYPAQPVAAKPLVVGSILFPPFYNIERKGETITEITGINVEIVTKVLERIGEKYILKYYPAKRLYANMVKGTTHVFYGLRVPASIVRPEYILHSRHTISKIMLRVFYLDSTPDVTRKEDLVGKSIIVFRGYGYGGFINFVKHPKNAMILNVADSEADGFKMLNKERADYLLAFERPALEAMKTLDEKYTQHVVRSDPLFVADGYFVISRKAPNAEKLLSRMESAYLQLESEGAFKEMIVK